MHCEGCTVQQLVTFDPQVILQGLNQSHSAHVTYIGVEVESDSV